MKVTIYSGISVEDKCGKQLHPLTEAKNAKDILDKATDDITIYSNSTDFISVVYHYVIKTDHELEFILDGVSLGSDIDLLFWDFNRSFAIFEEL